MPGMYARLEQATREAERAAKRRRARGADAVLARDLAHRCGGNTSEPAEPAQQPLRHRLRRLAALPRAQQQR